jgi:DNA-binding NarL/FixJ family response regulator
LSVVRILVVDNSEPWRYLVGVILQLNPNLQYIDGASDGLEAIQKAQELQPQLIILDSNLPKLSGIDATLQIRRVAPGSKILFLSLESDPDVVRTALRVGARGYVLKEDLITDLAPAVEAVILGKQFVSHGLTGSGTPLR